MLQLFGQPDSHDTKRCDRRNATDLTARTYCKLNELVIFAFSFMFAKLRPQKLKLGST